MKRYWPVFLALLCWLLVLAVPATRRGMVTDWQNAPRLSFEPGPNSAIGSQRAIPRDEVERLNRFSGDKASQIFLASLSADNVHIKLEDLAKRYPNDALFIAMQLNSDIFEFESRSTRASNTYGPISNPAGQSRTKRRSKHELDWERIIALARRGQALEPNNTYFDWILLYALYASFRDEEAYRVLQSASTKTDYDSHLRELLLNNWEITKRIHDSPLPTDKLRRLTYTDKWSWSFVNVAKWTMDGAVLQREKGDHQRALTNTYNLLRLSRVMRTEAYRISESSTALQCEFIGLNNSKRPTSVPSGLVTNQFWLYAQERNQLEIEQFARTEEADLRKWNDTGLYNRSWVNDSRRTVAIFDVFSELQAMLLKTLPVTLVLSLVFGVLAHHYGTTNNQLPTYKRGAMQGVLLLLLLLLASQYFAATRVWRVTPQPFLTAVPVWVILGVPFLLLCSGLKVAHRWQIPPQELYLTPVKRFQRLSPKSGEGSPLMSFGWFLGLALKFGFWLILGFLLFAFCQQFTREPNYFYNTNLAALGLMAVAVAFQLGTLGIGWTRLPKRSETLRLGFHTIHQAMVGYLVTASVLYALVALGGLPLRLNYERQWLQQFQTGEVQSYLAQMGH